MNMITHSRLKLATAVIVGSAAMLSIHSPVRSQPTVAGKISGPWLDASLSPDARADAALKAMTQQEKLDLLSVPMPLMVPQSKRAPLPIGAGHISGVPRLGIPGVAETDASLGVANLGHQRKGDVATALPSSLALGSSWDPELAYRGGAMIGSEARAKGFGVMLGGGVNLIRDPRAGRNFEYISEDPLLTGVLGGRAIAGIQSNNIISTIKHFALNNQETGRNVHSVDMAEAPMRESELLAFQIATEIGRPGSVMCAYNKVNSIYACENRFLLTDVLRRDWGFDGFVMSDWGSVHSAGALEAGLDQQSGYQLDRKRFFGPELEQALAAGQIPQSKVDAAVRRILRAMFAHGLVESPPVAGTPIDYKANSEVALAQAEAGLVLLRNERGVLPLASSAKRIAVIGGHADIGVLIGGGSSQVIPVGGLKLEERVKGEGLLAFIKRGYGGTPPLSAIKAAFPNAAVDFADGTDPAAAAALAAKADVAVVFAEKWFLESTDASDLSLGAGQDELISRVAKANRNTVVVLETGNPVAMPWIEQVPAVLVAWYPGQRGGDAIARVLAGSVNPSGHLPLTWPASLDQLPLPKLPGWDVPAPTNAEKANYGTQADKVPFSFSYPEGSDVGYRWFDRTKRKPLYAFGHGLSYTSFRYNGLKITDGDRLEVRFTVQNTGQRAGADVAQVYVRTPGKPKRLIGWGRPTLKPGESREVRVTADPRILASFDATQRRWVVADSTYQVEVGTSAEAPVLTASARLRQQTIKP